MAKYSTKKTLYDAYRFDGFIPVRELREVFGEHGARILRLNRRSKKLSAGLVGQATSAGTTRRLDWREIFRAETSQFTLRSTFAGLNVENVML